MSFRSYRPFRVRDGISGWWADWSSVRERLRYSAVTILYNGIVDIRKHLIIVYSFSFGNTGERTTAKTTTTITTIIMGCVEGAVSDI